MVVKEGTSSKAYKFENKPDILVKAPTCLIQTLLTLLNNIHNLKISNLANLKFLVIDDCSSEKLNKKIEFDSFLDIEIIKNPKNIGHGKSIANGINYLSKKNDFDYLIVMDGDGEDRPEEVKELILKSHEQPSSTITANRIKRSERRCEPVQAPQRRCGIAVWRELYSSSPRAQTGNLHQAKRDAVRSGSGN